MSLAVPWGWFLVFPASRSSMSHRSKGAMFSTTRIERARLGLRGKYERPSPLPPATTLDGIKPNGWPVNVSEGATAERMQLDRRAPRRTTPPDVCMTSRAGAVEVCAGQRRVHADHRCSARRACVPGLPCKCCCATACSVALRPCEAASRRSAWQGSWPSLCCDWVCNAAYLPLALCLSISPHLCSCPPSLSNRFLCLSPEAQATAVRRETLMEGKPGVSLR